MVTWAARRRLLYLSSIFIPIFLIVVVVGFFVLYEEPTCFDGKKNGDEIGRDCGGECRLLCSSQSLSPEILWSRAFEVVPNVYNLVAYIENPNIRSEVEVAPYIFKVYDQNNNVVTERTGVIRVPQRKTFAIFEGTVRTDVVPSRVTFEFTRELVWQKSLETEPDIEVQSTVLVDTDTSPRIDAVLENQSIENIEKVEAIVIIFDSNNNAIHASRTVLEDFNRNTSRRVVFTWPEAFDAGVGVCATPVDVALVVDRSGSMNDDGATPPEPLTTVKEAAGVFVGELSDADAVSVISFATEGSLDNQLTSNFIAATQTIGNIIIGENDSSQHTNVFDGLTVAHNELMSERNRTSVDNVIVLLTDGIASRPLDESNPDYAEEVAALFAQEIKQTGTEIYTIGLGESVNDDFLKTIATEQQYYYTAPTRDDVEAIYEQIATAICKKGPNIIQIIPRAIQ